MPHLAACFSLAILLACVAGARSAQADTPPLRVTFPNPNIFQSPYTWRNDRGSAIAPTGGSYLKGVVSGTTILRANVDTSLNAGQPADDMPTLKVTIEDQPPTFIQFPPGAAQVTLATLSPDRHRFRIEAIGGNQIKPDGWSGTTFQTKIDSLEFDAGATLSPPALRSKRALILGDSNIQAYFGQPTVGPYYRYVDYSLSWPGDVAFAFDCEFGQIGIGSTGWIHPGQGGYPAMPDWWDHYSAGQPRDLTLQPDYVWVALGANDHNVEPARLTEVITRWLARARKAFPAAEIFCVVPFHGENRAAVSAAVHAAHDADTAVPTAKTTATAAVSSSSSDPRLHLIDLGFELESAIPFRGGQTTWLTGDGLHLRSQYHGLIAAAIARQSQAGLGKADARATSPR
ncbi:MAG TPA: SGNH/GDSL hydrolase family protein [Pirellulales bacterium]|jgi:lysophospholipase L1-like esterase|nr:SGNH/GDSL hydrolase family protein [Pirellulales bacterium]